RRLRFGRWGVQRGFREPKIELVTAAVPWPRRGLRLAFRAARRTGYLDMKVLGVTIPGTHLEKPGAISSGVAAQRLLDRGIDQDAGDHWILRSGVNEFDVRMGPHFQIDVELIGRDHIGGRTELALLSTLHVVWHRRKPNIDIETDLMASVLGEHRPAARLRHVADQKTIPANLFRVVGKPFDEANELRIAPVAVTRQPHDLPSRSSDR